MAIGPKGIKTNVFKEYPVVEGLTAETTKQTQNPRLEPTNGSDVPKSKKVGL